VIIVADGEGVPAALPVAVEEAARAGVARPLVIAADGGSRRALDLGVTPDLVLGDGDSVGPETRAALAELGVPVELVDAAKDESDTELCLAAAVERGARVIRIVGALGGARVEHGVANLLLLAHPVLDGVDVAIVAPPSRIRRIGTADGPGEVEVAGAPGDLLSLLPIDTVVEGVVTHDLRFPLRDEPLLPGPARGLSNELLTERARVTSRRGRLLVIHTIARGTTEPTP
jgi:thiamine pyrophosphokinase